MIKGIGTDIIEIERLACIQNPHFAHRCFTLREQAYYTNASPHDSTGDETSGCTKESPSDGATVRLETAAGFFAAKEAVVKALGTGFRGFWPCAVEILHDEWGRPYVVLHGEAEKIAREKGISQIWVSLSHNRTTAMATAVAEGGF